MPHHRALLQFPGGLVFKAHRRVHYSTLGLRVIKKKKKKSTPAHDGGCIILLARHAGARRYRGTSLIRNNSLLETYSRTMSRAIWWS